MATRALSADAGRASSEITSPAPTRRAMLGLAAGAAAVVLPIGAKAAPKRMGRDTTAWDAAWSAHEDAISCRDGFYANEIDPLARLYPRDPTLDPVRVGTSKTTGEAIMARFWGRDFEVDHWHPYVENRGWLEAREKWRAYCSDRDAFEARTGYSQLEARGDELTIAAADARDAMLMTPAPHLTALRRKLELIFDDEEVTSIPECGELRKVLRADLTLLADRPAVAWAGEAR